MKILYVHSSSIPSRAANSIQVANMCNAFAKLGHDVSLLAPNTVNKEKNVDNIFDYYGIPQRFTFKLIPKLPFKGSTYLFKALLPYYTKKIKPDVVFSRSIGLLYNLRSFNCQFIFEAHHPINEFSPDKVRQLQFLIRKKKITTIVVISAALKKMFLEVLPELEERLIVAHDGASIEQNNGQTHIKNKVKGQLNVTYVGHLYEGRGVDLIMELAKRCTWAYFNLVGGRDVDVLFWKKKYRELENVKFIGFVTPQETHHYRNKADILIAPYQKTVLIGNGKNTVDYMSPLKIFEYMAVKKPIITSDLPVLKEVLLDRYNALLCDPDKINQWEEAINHLRNNKALREKLANNAFNTLIEKYTWDARAKAILEL